MCCQAVLMVTWKHYLINNGQGKLVALGPFLTVLDELHTPDSHISLLFKVWSLDPQQLPHLGICLKSKFLGSSTNLLNETFWGPTIWVFKSPLGYFEAC